MLVDLFWEEYFQYKSLHNKTIGLDQIRYKKYIQKWIGRKDLADVSGADILKIQRDLAENKLSPKTNNNILGVVSAMFSYAIEKDLVPKNPVRSIRKLKINNKRERFLSVDEINTLLQSVKGNEPLELFVLLALSTGARLSSIVNLRVKDVNFANKSVNLLDYKGNSNYTGFLNESTFSKLERFMDCSPNEKLIAKSRYYVEVQLKSILDGLFNQDLRKDDRKNRVVIHTLRHTFASHLALKGTPLLTIQKLMNHKDINMTLRYSHLMPDNGQKEVESLYNLNY